MDARPRDPTFAIAFGGGGARGLAHIHIAETLDELGIRPVAIAGSSIGAIVGAGVAAGMSGREIREYTVETLGRPAEVAARVWRSRPSNIAGVFGGGVRIGQFDISRILRAFLPAALPERFEDLTIPLAVTATDFYGNEEIVFDSGELLPAVAASAAVPGIFRPVERGEQLLIDGGISNPVPFDLLMDKADIVIAIDVVGTPNPNREGRPGSIDLVLGAGQIMMQSITSLKLQRSRPHIMLRPPVSKFRILDFLKVKQVLEETAAIRDELKFAIEQAVERFNAEDLA
ncbi:MULTISPECIES: patatin-like phospholipase family protein [unclassified Aminobacter]|uniref:patatin-like phospholipase family protein n=1 Tax=unclassified Aminobacter TaxID=2644704 RepID=UPI000465A2BA|nr:MULTISPECIES: patatin-like phospholipase family protein [unclassified Aminobacter]TWG61770.1 NTE family protein [Aminobacter sp. J44]TWH34029.1 NTE family protein [Aminobacter sp. J15]